MSLEAEAKLPGGARSRRQGRVRRKEQGWTLCLAGSMYRIRERYAGNLQARRGASILTSSNPSRLPIYNMSDRDDPISFATLGMFIIDDFSFMDADGRPTGRTVDPQECRSRPSSLRLCGSSEVCS